MDSRNTLLTCKKRPPFFGGEKMKGAKKKLPAFLCALLAAVLVIGMIPITAENVSAATTRGLDSIAHTQDEIRTYYKAHPVQNLDFTFEEEPSVKAPYSPGKLSDASLQDVLNLLNIYRYITGVNPVEIATEGQDYAQSAALLCAVNHTLAHSMSAPNDMSEDLKSKSAFGLFNSNLAGGGTSLAAAIRRFMLETNGDPNFGHRRQLLKYDMMETGFGTAVSDTGGSYMATYVNANLKEDKVLSYPGENQPLEFFGNGYCWTVIVPEKVTKDSVKVTLTDTKTGKKWEFSSELNNMRMDISYNSACLIFNPEEITYREGDRYQVDITGIPEPISYNVNMFYVDDKIPVESVKCDVSGIFIYPAVEGKDYSTDTIGAIISPDNASNKNIEWISEDPSVAYPVWAGSRFCKAIGVKPGETTFTAITEDGGLTDTVTVTVRPRATSIETIDELVLGVGQSKKIKPTVLPKESSSHAYINYLFDNTVVKPNQTNYLGQMEFTGLKVGETEIKWYASSDHDVIKMMKVKVVEPVYVNSIILNEDSIELKNGETFQLEAAVSPANATLKDLEWTSSDRNIAKVDGNGLVTIGGSLGTATITVRALDGSGVRAECTVTRHRHVMEEIAAAPATCEEGGVQRYWKCSTCGELFSDRYGITQIEEPVAIPAKGHSWRTYATVDKQATCTEEGLKSIHCSVCGAVHEGSEQPISKTQHSMIYTAAKPATTQAEGNIEYWRCRDCQMYFSDADGTIGILREDTVISKKTGEPTDPDGNGEEIGNDDPDNDEEFGQYFNWLEDPFEEKEVLAPVRIEKKANTLKVKISKKTFKQSNLKKTKKFSIGAKKAKGRVTYKLNKKAKKAGIKVSKKGKVTIPKRCKRGTYKIAVRAAGNNAYKPGTKTVIIRIS